MWLAALVLGMGLMLAGPTSSPAQFGGAPAGAPIKGAHRADHLEVALVSDRAFVRPGEAFRLGLRLAHDPGWHTYWRNPGDSGLATRFEPVIPGGMVSGPIEWPAPERIAVGPLANYGYEGETLLWRVVTVPQPWQGGPHAAFTVDAQWLVCREVCIPGEARLALDLPIASGSSTPSASPWSEHRAAFERAAAAVPDRTASVTVPAQRSADRLLIELPTTVTGRRVEFFPYFEGVVTPAADQRLVRAQAEPERRLLVMAIAPDAQAAVPDNAAEGLLVVDGKPIELRLAWQTMLPAPGETISVATVQQPAAAVGPSITGIRPGDSLLSRVLSPGSVADPSAVAPGTGPSSAPITGSSPAAPATGQSPAVSASLLLAAGGALIGGLLLNLMPCVFPVIGLKVLSFAASGAGSRARRRHAFAFAAGVVLSFVVLGALLLALRSVGQAAGWGFQMQSPVFVASMCLLFVAIALNLFGVFEVGARLTTIDARGQGMVGHFSAGVVAVLVATPCTAPFMGSAIGFTLGTGAIQTLLIFVALGLGMAIPYLLFGLVPGLLRLLPRPGPWLEGFRQVLAFPMLATAAWLAWVLTLQTGADGVLRLLIAAVVVGFAAWLHGRSQQRRHPGRRAGAGPRVWSTAAAIAMTTALGTIGWQLVVIERLATEGARVDAADRATAPAVSASESGTGDAIDWRPWSRAAVEQALDAGRPVFVDFTAAWCISCQANKKIALERDAVRRVFARAGIVALRADWTRSDPAITAELARHGRNGVPLYLYYGGSSRTPAVLPELLTAEIVVAAVSRPLPVGMLGR